MPGELTNGDIFAYVVYRLQGTGRFVDVEDVYVECWRLSPSRFGLRKHPYPNTLAASKAQVHVQRMDPEFLLKAANGRSVQLSAKGVAWVRERLADFEQLASGVTKAPATHRASHKLITDLVKSPLVHTFLAGNDIEPRRIEVAELFRCAPDSPASIWQERMATLRSAAEDDERPDLVRFLDYVRNHRADWFTGG